METLIEDFLSQIKWIKPRFYISLRNDLENNFE